MSIIWAVTLVSPTPLLRTSGKLTNVFNSACQMLCGNLELQASSSSFKEPDFIHDRDTVNTTTDLRR